MSKHAYISLIRFEWKCFRRRRMIQFAIYTLLLSAISVSMTQPFIFKKFIDNIQNTSSLSQEICSFFMLSFGVKIIEWLLFTPAYYLQRKISFTIFQEYISSTYRSLYNEDQLLFRTEKHSGSELSRIRKSCDGCRDYFNDQFHYVEVLFRIVLSIIAISYFAPFLGILAFILGGLALYLTMFLDKRYSISQNKLLEREHLIFSFFADLLRNLSTIVSLNLFQSIDSVLKKRVLSMKEHYYKSNLISMIKLVSVDIIIISMTLILIIGFILKNSDVPPNQYIGSLVALFSYISIYTGLFKEFTWINTLATDTYVNIASFSINSEQEIKQFNSENESKWKNIRIQSIRPKSKNIRDVPVLEKGRVGLELNTGESLLIVGKSGSGKSTILEILNGNLPSSKETMFFIDNKPVSQQEFSKLTMYSPQDTYLFNETVLFNIVLGSIYSEQDIKTIIRVTGLDLMLKDREEGLQSVISENGNNLSGGQKQRILLSRYLFFLNIRKKQILMLDESTSALDKESESIILDNIFMTFPDLSVVMITHNKLLEKKFNKILYLR